MAMVGLLRVVSSAFPVKTSEKSWDGKSWDESSWNEVPKPPNIH